MSEIDISYWPKKKITETAEALLGKIMRAGWKWEVEYHDDPDRDSISTSYYALNGESEKHGLSIMMILGRVPWTTRWRLNFTKNGREYCCLDEVFGEVPKLKKLYGALDKIGRQVKERQDRQARKNRARQERLWRRNDAVLSRELLRNLEPLN